MMKCLAAGLRSGDYAGKTGKGQRPA